LLRSPGKGFVESLPLLTLMHKVTAVLFFSVFVVKFYFLFCCGRLLAEIWDPEAISRKQFIYLFIYLFIVPAQTQQTHVQWLSPENKGVSPYIALQAGYRSKKQSSTHI
jgi:hypothetical protein